jgi:hypothetical protein
MSVVSSHTVTLTCHPETGGRALHGITAHVERGPGDALALCYVLQGRIADLRVPPPRPQRPASRLWEHTCCEIFVARSGSSGYHELNLSPSGEWAVYAFERYRQSVPPPDAHLAEDLDPQITLRRAADELRLNALIRLKHLFPAYVFAKLSLGLSAVVEDKSGALSYWALKHPPGRPDFHHADAFALQISAADTEAASWNPDGTVASGNDE